MFTNVHIAITLLLFGLLSHVINSQTTCTCGVDSCPATPKLLYLKSSNRGCMNARDDKPSKFLIPEDFEITDITLKHINGTLICTERDDKGTFGCNSDDDNGRMALFISDGNRNLLYPQFAPGQRPSFYDLAGYPKPYSLQEITIPILPNSLFLTKGAELWVWYGEDFNDYLNLEANNGGEMCLTMTLNGFATSEPIFT